MSNAPVTPTLVQVDCPADGAQLLPCERVLVDQDRRMVAFSCPACGDVVRQHCSGASSVRLSRAVLSGAGLARLGPVRRPEVCDGRPWTGTEAFELHCHLAALPETSAV